MNPRAEPFRYNGSVPDNRRSQTRYHIAIEAQLTVNGAASDQIITNLSLGGCGVGHPQRLGIGTRVEVAFRIPTHEDVIRVGGAVRWSNDDGSGVQFDGLRAKEVWALNKYFESLRDS